MIKNVVNMLIQIISLSKKPPDELNQSVYYLLMPSFCIFLGHHFIWYWLYNPDIFDLV